jgi:hypothetical protein
MARQKDYKYIFEPLGALNANLSIRLIAADTRVGRYMLSYF